MAKVESSIEIEAPVQEVWDVVADPERLSEWVTIDRGVSGVPERLEAGSTFKQRLSVAGREFDVDWTVTEISEPHRLLWRGEGPLGTGATTRYELYEDGRSTRFDYLNEFEPPGGLAGKAVGAAMAAAAKGETRRTLDRLKQLIEGRG